MSQFLILFAEEMEMVEDSLPPVYANIMDKLMRGKMNTLTKILYHDFSTD